MKWNNHDLHSFEQYWLEKEYFIWGAGATGALAFQEIGDYVKIKGFIDSNPAKQETGYCGCKVFSYEEAKQSDDDIKIIIAANHDAYSEVSGQLINDGYLPNRDFCLYQGKFTKLIRVNYYARYKQIHCGLLEVPITQRCTLSCKHCALQIPAFHKPQDRSVADILSDIDAFFSYFDYVQEMRLLGGETFLHAHLPELVEQIMDKWHDRIGELYMFTNGTIVPDEHVLAVLKKYDAIIQISDYSQANPDIADDICQIVDTAQKLGIRCRRMPPEHWVDFGSVKEVGVQDPEQAKAVFQDCFTHTRTLFDKKFYFCSRQMNAELLNQISSSPNDYFPLADYDSSRKLEALKLDMGYTELGYVTLCASCYGIGASNTRTIPAGEQI